MRLEEAIKQKQFPLQRFKIGVNVLYTASWLSNEQQHVLRPFGITWQQFNLMRIVKGQKGNPASLKLISERMIDRQSNTSRLVDKLVAKGLISRTSCPKDRRQVDIFLTEEGSTLLDQASEQMAEMTARLFGHITEDELATINDGLENLRITEINNH